MKLFAELLLAYFKMVLARQGHPPPAPVLPVETRPRMRFTHSCEKCSPVQQYGRYDLYVCDDNGQLVAVARYGNAPSEHISSTDLFLPDEGIRMTYSRL